MGATPIVVGVLIAGVDGTFQRPIVDGLREQATRLGVSLLFFPGNNLSTEVLFMQQLNAAYGLARSSRVDAILSITTTFNARQTAQAMQAMLESYQRPVFSFGTPLPGISAVVHDNASGMSQLMNHLTQVHGHRRIAFMQGTQGNVDAEVRYQTYLNGLAAHGLAFDPALVVRGNFTHVEGRSAMRQLLANGKPFDVLMAANDEMALAAWSVALELGHRVPEDFAITGFDDLMSAHRSGPALTTVHQGISEQAATALRFLVKRVHGETIPDVIPIETRVVIRQTCGCLGSTEHDHALLPAGHAVGDTIIKGLNLHHTQEAAWRAHLEALRAVLFGNDAAPFEKALNAAASACLRESADMAPLQALLLGMQRHLLKPAELGDEQMARMSIRLQNGQILIAGALRAHHALDEFMRWSNQRSLGGFLKTGMSSFDQQELVNILHQTLKRLEIPTCYLALYEQPIQFDSLAGFVPPPRSRLILARTGHQRHPEMEGVAFATEQLIPGPISPTAQPVSLGVLPIFLHNQHFGYIVIDILANPKLEAEQIREEVSTMLTETLLVTELARARDLLREDLDVASRKNQRLEVLAELDELTGLYNRRGFFERARQLIETAALYPIVLVAADLDGLKQINDQHGHAEGDFALRAAGQLLQDAFRTTDLVCRLGGDEFVVLSMQCEPLEIDHIRNRVYGHFDRFNLSSGKPYAVGCSLGFCVIDPDTRTSLGTLLNQADQYLYEEKRKRNGR